MKALSKIFFAVFAALFCGSIIAPPAQAEVLCKRRHGMVVVRDVCRDHETQLDPATLGFQPAVPCLSQEGTEVTFSGCNVHIENGMGATGTTNGLGNLFVGYNEDTGNYSDQPLDRSGSHNLVVGEDHTFPNFGGVVAGQGNRIMGRRVSVLGGSGNTAGGDNTVVSGGKSNLADGSWAAVSGGEGNWAGGHKSSICGGDHGQAFGEFSTVTGGGENIASGKWASVTGGGGNVASGVGASVTGGTVNTASGSGGATVSGGSNNVAAGHYSAISGGQANLTTGMFASVTGGLNNHAGGPIDTPDGQWATVSGGYQRSAVSEKSWTAGSLFEPN